MTHEGIEYVIRVGIGRNEWALLIYYPDKTDGKPVVVLRPGFETPGWAYSGGQL